jgi:hypothetical protein
MAQILVEGGQPRANLAIGPGGDILAQGPYGDTAEAIIPVPFRPGPRRAADDEPIGVAL